MFKNRALQVKMVKPEASTPDITVTNTLDAVNETIATSVKPIAMAVVAVIGAKTLSEVVLHATRTYIK